MIPPESPQATDHRAASPPTPPAPEPLPRRGLPRGLVALGAAAALLFVGSLAAVLVMAPWRGTSPPGEDPTGAYRSADPAEPDANLDGLTLLPFTMADQLGRPVTQDIFLGKVTIMDFGFTRCPLVCPIMRSRMADLRDRLRDVPVQFVTISIDPEHDTPEVLRAYAAEVEADPERWRFLTGDKATAWRLVREGLLFAVEEDPIPGPDGASVFNIRHPTRFFLIGPRGNVLGMYEAGDDQAAQAELPALAQRARALARRLGRG